MQNSGRIDIKTGDIIDVRATALVGSKKKHQFTQIVLRSEDRKHWMQLLAPPEDIDLITARIVSIDKVSHQRWRYNSGFWNVTICEVTLENAFGERPNLVAENDFMTAVIKRDQTDAEWVRPEFTTGDVKNGEEEN